MYCNATVTVIVIVIEIVIIIVFNIIFIIVFIIVIVTEFVILIINVITAMREGGRDRGRVREVEAETAKDGKEEVEMVEVAGMVAEMAGVAVAVAGGLCPPV